VRKGCEGNDELLTFTFQRFNAPKTTRRIVIRIAGCLEEAGKARERSKARRVERGKVRRAHISPQ